MPAQFAVVYLLLAIVLSAALAILAWRNKATRGNKAFAAACYLSIPWMIGQIIVVASETMPPLWVGEILKYVGATLMPVALYVFTRQYCGSDPSWRTIAALMIVPSITMVTMLTNSWHHLFFLTIQPTSGELFTKYGSYFWAVHIPYSYVLLSVCLYTVLSEISRSSRQHRKQLVYLLFSLCVPTIFNVLSVSGLVGKITPYSFPIFFILMAYAIFRLRFLGSNPIAYETVFETIRDGVLIVDRNDVIQDANPAAADSLGRPVGEIIGSNLADALALWPAAVEFFRSEPEKLGLIEVGSDGGSRYFHIESTAIKGVNRRNSDGRVVTIHDNTDRHLQQLSLEAMAFHDPLTRLANRRKFDEEVERAIETSRDGGQNFTIVYFDLNEFKQINDTHGHEVGDEMLKYVGARVASILRKPDLLSRLGGDEFAILLHDCDDAGVKLVIDRMLDNVMRPLKIGKISLVAELSIGTAVYPRDGASLSQLLRNADASMYESKQNGGGWFTSDAAVEFVGERVM